MTTQLFRNFHYQEFYYTDRQIQLKLKIGVFTEVVDKSVRNAISSQNKTFLDTFHNVMKEAIHGFPVGQVRLDCYNILDPST